MLDVWLFQLMMVALVLLRVRLPLVKLVDRATASFVESTFLLGTENICITATSLPTVIQAMVAG